MKPPALGVARPSLLSPRPLICECAAVLLSRALLLTSLTGTVAMVAVVVAGSVSRVCDVQLQRRPGICRKERLGRWNRCSWFGACVWRAALKVEVRGSPSASQSAAAISKARSLRRWIPTWALHSASAPQNAHNMLTPGSRASALLFRTLLPLHTKSHS